jgi:hypothetical protein
LDDLPTPPFLVAAVFAAGFMLFSVLAADTAVADFAVLDVVGSEVADLEVVDLEVVDLDVAALDAAGLVAPDLASPTFATDALVFALELRAFGAPPPFDAVPVDLA